MSEPRRLLEQGADEFEQKILKSARCEIGSVDGYQRTLAAMTGVATGLAVTSGATASATAVGSAGAGSIAVASVSTTVLVAKWVGIGVLASSAILGTAQVIQSSSVSNSSASSQVKPVMSSSIPVLSVEQAKPIPILPAPEPSSAPSIEVKSIQVALPSPVPSVSAEPIRSNISGELGLLEKARVALEKGDWGAGQVVLESYAKQFPQGTLLQEATILKIRLLLGQGDLETAKKLAQTFVDASPGSPHISQIRIWFPDMTIP